MLYYCLYILPVIPLWFMMVSDLKRRTISIYWLCVFAVAVFVLSFYKNGLQAALANMVFNMSLIFFMFGLAFSGLFLLHGGKIKPLQKYAGAGDFFFVMALAPLFEFREYTTFLIIALAVSILWYPVNRILFPASGQFLRKEIPLVSTVGCQFIFYLFIN